MDGGMTRSELRTLVLDWVDDPSAGYFTTSILNMRLNLAMRELQKNLISANKEYYTQCVKTTTVVNQAAYALPSDFMQVIRLEIVLSGTGDNADTQTIDFMTPNQVDLFDSTTGNPMFYYFNKNDILLKPVPSSALELRLTYSSIAMSRTRLSSFMSTSQFFAREIAS
jgi:hypothetical protein